MKRTIIETLKGLVGAGLKARYGDKPDKRVKLRVMWELKHIIDVGFANSYVMGFWIFRQMAEPAGIHFWARGATASSIVCYCLGLTEIDPLRYGLHSVRFVNDKPPKFQFDIESSRMDEFMQMAEKCLSANAKDIDVESVRKSLMQDLTPKEYLSRRRERPLPENIDDELARYALYFPDTMDLYQAYVRQPSSFDGIIYQEQMMDILRETFHTSGIKANTIRLAIQRGEAERVEAYKQELFAGLKNITKEEAETAWQHLTSNPRAFLKAHAVSYVLASYKYKMNSKNNCVLSPETKLIMRTIILIILTAGLYLVWIFYKSNSEFIPFEPISLEEGTMISPEGDTENNSKN